MKKVLTSERICGIITLPLSKGFFFVRFFRAKMPQERTDLPIDAPRFFIG